MTDGAGLHAELLALRKGRGVLAPGLLDGLGPQLRERAGIEPAMPTGKARERLTAVLEAGCRRLPADLGDGVRAGLAIRPLVGHRFLRERLEWYAERLGRERRVLHGGQLVLREHPSQHLLRTVLQLPRPLAAGDRHEFGLSITLPAGQPMAPHYVLTPLRRYSRFELVVRFGQRRPDRLWRVDGVPPRVLDDPPGAGELVRPDRFGELSLRFDRLRRGLSYGVRWQP